MGQRVQRCGDQDCREDSALDWTLRKETAARVTTVSITPLGVSENGLIFESFANV